MFISYWPRLSTVNPLVTLETSSGCRVLRWLWAALVEELQSEVPAPGFPAKPAHHSGGYNTRIRVIEEQIPWVMFLQVSASLVADLLDLVVDSLLPQVSAQAAEVLLELAAMRARAAVLHSPLR